MKRAIFDLFESPHNRFKVFKDGHLIYTDKIGLQENVDLVLNEFFKGKLLHVRVFFDQLTLHRTREF